MEQAFYGYGPDTGTEDGRIGNERAFIRKLLEEFNWNLIKTASALRISVTRLKLLMKLYGIRRPN